MAQDDTNNPQDQSIGQFMYDQNTRLGQQNVLPGTIRRRLELTAEKVPEVTVYQRNSRYYGNFSDIQQALTYVNNLGGGRVVVNPGTYPINGNLTIYKNTELVGITGKTTILDFNKTTYNLSTAANASFVTIRNLTFNNCFNTTQGTIYLNSASQSQILNCNFNNNATGGNAGYDINSSSSNGIIVQGCNSTGAATFYNASSPQGTNNVSNNYIYSAVNYVIQNAAQTVLQNNYFQGCTSSIFRGGFRFSTIANSVVSSQAASAFCLDLTASSTVHVIGNYFPTVSQCTSVSRSQFAANYFYTGANNTPALAFSLSYENTIVGNTIFSNNSANIDGIKFSGATTKTAITGNTIDTTQGTGTGYAVNISDAGSQTNAVVGNRLAGTTAATNNAGGVSNIIASNA